MFLGTSLIEKAIVVFGNMEGDVRSARWIWERVERRWWRGRGDVRGEVERMES